MNKDPLPIPLNHTTDRKDFVKKYETVQLNLTKWTH